MNIIMYTLYLKYFRWSRIFVNLYICIDESLECIIYVHEHAQTNKKNTCATYSVSCCSPSLLIVVPKFSFWDLKSKIKKFGMKLRSLDKLGQLIRILLNFKKFDQIWPIGWGWEIFLKNIIGHRAMLARCMLFFLKKISTGVAPTSRHLPKNFDQNICSL